MSRSVRSIPFFSLIGLCGVLASLANAAEVQVPTVVTERFSVLSFDTLNPEARQLSFNLSNPNRSLVETRVDNKADFDFRLYNTNPDSVGTLPFGSSTSGKSSSNG